MLRTLGQVLETRPGRRPLVAVTGSHCPVSGVWVPSGEEGSACRVLEGSVMPAFRNSAVEWKLLKGIKGRGMQS